MSTCAKVSQKHGYKEKKTQVYIRRGYAVSMRAILAEFNEAHREFCRRRGLAPEGEWATNKSARDLHRSR